MNGKRIQEIFIKLGSKIVNLQNFFALKIPWGKLHVTRNTMPR